MISAARASLSASTTATESEYARPERCWRSHHPAQSGPRARTPTRSGQTLDGLGPKFNLKFKLKIASSESACRRRAKRTVGTQAVRAVLLITRDDIKCQGSEAQSQSVAAAAYPPSQAHFKLARGLRNGRHAENSYVSIRRSSEPGISASIDCLYVC